VQKDRKNADKTIHLHVRLSDWLLDLIRPSAAGQLQDIAVSTRSPGKSSRSPGVRDVSVLRKFSERSGRNEKFQGSSGHCLIDPSPRTRMRRQIPEFVGHRLTLFDRPRLQGLMFNVNDQHVFPDHLCDSPVSRMRMQRPDAG
jgi:hypothetical protein